MNKAKELVASVLMGGIKESMQSAREQREMLESATNKKFKATSGAR